METLHDASAHHEHASHHKPEHHREIKPIDSSYRLVVRTVLWVIAGLVFVGFVIWWALT